MIHSGPLSAPHTRSPDSVPKIMLTVLAALLPATAFGITHFGWPALNLLLLTCASALLTEAAALAIAGKPVRPALTDGSALLTAWLLAMSLPPWAPWWIGVLGGFFAILVGKQVFGGIGQNLFNPAMLARVVLLISFPLQMTLWTAPAPLFAEGSPSFSQGVAITFNGIPNIDAVSSATPLGHVKTELTRAKSVEEALQTGHYSASADALGTLNGSLGETSALLLLLGAAFLLWRGIITWQIPVAMLTAVGVLALAFHVFDAARYASPGFHLLSGGLILGAFFIATDPVGSPSSTKGQLVFGAGCGALTYIIRTWGGYPEGIAFAVMLMNATTPIIDHYLRPRIYGRTLAGAPRSYETANEESRP